MRRPLALALLLPTVGLAFIGCGKQEPVSTPVACLGGADQWFSALHEIEKEDGTATQDQVRLGGATPLSECIPPDQPAGQQETVGKTAVDVATRLASGYGTGPQFDSQGNPAEGSSAWQAGFLAGSLERGAKKSQGIHATLVERVRSAATNGLDQASNQEQQAYEQGYEAGLETG